MTVERVGPGQYRVDGPRTHYVDLTEPSCDCADFIWRKEGKVQDGKPAYCKHQRAVIDHLKETP